jgi:hypothetical protein
VTISFYYRMGAAFAGTLVPYITSSTGVDQNWSAAWAGVVNQTSGAVPVSTSWTKVSFSAQIPISASQVAVFFSYAPTTATAVANDYFDITGVQLEKGTIATPFEVRPYATELALCQRYYQEMPNINGGHFTGNGRCVFAAAATNGSFCGTGIYFQMSMRTTPTPTFYGSGTAPGTFYVYTGSSGSQVAYVQSTSNVTTAQISSITIATNIITSSITASGGTASWVDLGWGSPTLLGITLNAEL